MNQSWFLSDEICSKYVCEDCRELIIKQYEDMKVGEI